MSFKKQYRDLEMQVMRSLRDGIESSSYQSKHTGDKAIKLKVDISDYTELTIINDRLTFLDRSGYHYDINQNCTLEDLISIIEN